jgi:uncharacterized protein (DUF302 family)
MPVSRHRTHTSWVLGIALAMVTSACATAAPAEPIAPPAMPDQPPGTIEVAAGQDVPQTVQQVTDAITAAGGAVVAVVDHTAEAAGVGVQIPPNTVVIGGPTAARLPLLRVGQQAGAELPQRYLVQQAADGTVTLTTNSPVFVAAASGVAQREARVLLEESTTTVVRQVAGEVPLGSPLIGVTPNNRVLTVPTDDDVADTVARLERTADGGASGVVATVDLLAGPPDGGPPVRPTAAAFVGTPEAAAPLIAAAPSFGLDLPLRFVVWRDEQNRTQVGYPDVRRLAARHGVPVDDPNVVRLAADADRIARFAAGAVE